MPRKTKEQNEPENKNIEKKSTTKKATKSTVAAKKETSTTKKSAAAKKVSTSKTAKTSTKKTSSAKPVSSTKKSATSKKKSTTTKRTRTKSPKIEIVEYYDLPYRYNQTIVKVLAQTPSNLFIYWDISDEDRKNFKKQYGENFFEQTRPILIVRNNTLNYSFEVEINDFANSWYLHVNDAKCDYKIELGRRPILKNETINTDYIHVASSNKIEAPNDRILFNTEQKMVYFRNVKTGIQTSKEFNNISFIRNMGKIYNIYDLYKAIYQDENVKDIYNGSNPSS